MSDQTLTLSPETIAAHRANWHTLGLPIADFDAAVAEHSTPAAPLPPAAPIAEPNIRPDDVAAARAYWVEQGHDAALFDAAIASDAHPVGLAPTLTPAQAETLAETLAGAGRTEAEIAEIMEQHGLVPDPLSDEERAWNAECGIEHREPSDYKIDIRATGIAETTDISALLAIGNEWGQVLASMRIAPALGTDLAEKSISLAHRLAASTPAERQLWKMDQRAQALAAAGSEAALAENIRYASHAGAMAIEGHSEAVEALIASGVLDSAYMIAILAGHGRAIEAWAKGPPKGKRT